jgi:hypothetical protein
VNEKADVLACLEIYIEGQDFKKKTPKGTVIDYFRSLGEIKAFANSLYNYREIPENDDIDHYILRHTRGKINYLNGMTYYMKYDQFKRTTVQDYYYLNTKKEIPTKDLSREFAIARTNCYTHLCEARFWLGFECERIKNEKQ